MDKEFDFWMQNRVTKVPVNGREFTLAHYDVEVDAPRPGNCLSTFILLRSKIHITKFKEYVIKVSFKIIFRIIS